MTEREKLLKKIMSYTFAAYDWNLYLDTHPTDKDAIAQYHRMLDKVKELRTEFLSKYEPLQASESTNPSFWEWIEEPWPWDRY